jgi:probable FeS assembly SUF system protein SufT
MPESNIVLRREVAAILIPSGTPTLLKEHTVVQITQSLGDSHTVLFPGGMARIDKKDNDALGLEVAQQDAPTVSTDEKPDEKTLMTALKKVYDPEIPVNVVDLGLIYDCRLVEPASGQYKAEIKMTLTAPGCGMGPAIAQDAKNRLLAVPGITEAEVDIVWDPPWNQSMISEVGKMQLGLI